MAQTSYDMDQDEAVAGLPYSASGASVQTLTFNNPADTMAFGLAAAKVSGDDNGCEQPASAGADIIGVTVRDSSLEYDSSNENAYPVSSAVAVMRRGQIYVQVEEAVTPDDDVFIRHTANAPLTTLGIFRTDNDGGNALQLTTAKFLTSAGAGELAVLDLNIA